MGFLKKLREDSQSWVELGLISPLQRESILKLYIGKERGYFKSSFILKSIAALFVGVAFFLLISANWKYFPLWLRSGTVLLPLIISHAMVYYFWKKSQITAVEIWAFLASLLLGANIFLQAQIFHILNPYAQALLGWMAGVLPALFWLKTMPLAYLYLFLQVLHVVTTNITGKFSYLWLFLYLPNLILYFKKPSRLFFYGILVSALVNMAVFLTQVDGSAYFFSFVLGLFGYGFTVHVAIESDSKIRFVFIWYLFFIAYLLSFTEVSPILFLGSLNGHLVLGFLASLILVFSGKIPYIEKILIGIFSLIIILLKAIFSEEGRIDRSLLTAWVINLFILFTSLFLIYVGFRRQKKGIFFTGLSFLLFLAFARYVTLVRDYVTTALLFIFLAILLWYLNRRWEKLYGEK